MAFNFPNPSMTGYSPVGFGRQDKNANTSAGSYMNMPQIATQRYIPLGQKREFDHDEQKDVNHGLNQWIPSLWASYSTPITNLLANPAKNAIIGGAVTTAACAVIALFSRPRTRAIFLPASLVFGAIGGILTYFERRQQNDNILDVMKRLPAGSTKRDLLSDPAYQADLDRKAQQNTHHHYWY